MATNLLEFEEQDTNFLFLNIIGHDVIHDYGEPNSERWKKNKDLILENHGGAAAFISNTPQTLDTNHVFKFVDKNQIPNTDVDDFTKNKMHWKPEDYEILSKQEDDIFINQIKSDILLRVFKYIFLNKNTPTEYPLEINDLVENCLKYDDEDEDENKLKNIYNQISDDFKNKNQSNKPENGKQVIEILGKYLEKDFLTLLLSDQNTKPKGGSKRKKYSQDKENPDNVNPNKKQKISKKEIIKKSGKEFRAFIAKMALYVTNITDNNPETKTWPLDIQFELLNNISNTENSISDFDEKLYETFENQYKNYKTQKFKCNNNNNIKYIINNASHISIDTVKAYGFCPYSSIIDAMRQCSWKKSEEYGRETGNMNFKIKINKNEDYFYHGITKIENGSIEIILNIKLPNLDLSITKKINDIENNKKKDLQAWFVLKNTLTKILNYVEINKSLDFKDENIFEKLFELGKTKSQTQSQTEFSNIFQTIYSEILFKGVGDLFQEINAVAKNGGYNDKIINNDIIRLFVANDNPSACRFMFMLINGKADQINTKAFGGYFSYAKYFLIKRNENANVCEPKTPKRGGRKTKRKRKQKRKTHKNTSNISSYPQNPK